MAKENGHEEYYVDRMTGTYGSREDLIMVDIPKFFSDTFSSMSDDERIEFAKYVTTMQDNISQGADHLG